MSDLCPKCFAERQNTQYCPFCNFEYDKAYIPSIALSPMTILKGRYVLGKTLGIGGFGITYLALDMESGQKCAVKEFMPSELAVRDENGNVYASSYENKSIFEHCKDGFINEARALFTFSGDPTIVDVLDYFTEKNTAFLVMEFLDGCNLKEQMRKLGGRVPIEIATVMLVTIGSALMAVHKKNILHRDISPENIFLTNTGEYRLIDFGASRFFTSRENKSLSVLLKPGFAPPEQYSSKGNQGPWTDVYALAATYYYLLSGIKPIDTMDRLSGKEMPTLIEVCPYVPIRTSQAVSRAMEVNYRNRYQDIVSFLNDVDINCISSMQTNISNNGYATPSPADNKKQNHTPSRSKTIFLKKRKSSVSGVAKRPVLRCFCDTAKEFEFALEPNRQVIIGRGNASEITITDDLNISRMHCCLIFNSEKNKLYIQDYSSNGTFFADGERLQHNLQYEVTQPFYLSDTKNTFSFCFK